MEALYLEDSYLKEFKAKVLRVDGVFITLDKTAFYPVSGGQAHDTGFLYRGDEEFKVIFVKKISGEISHQVDKEGLKEGDRVNGKIDWDRRYQLMKMHTAAHLLASRFHDKSGALITGGQLEVEKSRIDFALEEFDKEKIKGYIDECNSLIERDLPVRFYWATKEEIDNNPELVKLAKGFDESIKKIRIVEIEGVDKQADGGCHVASLKEIGKVVFLRADNKGKNNRRVYYTIK